MKTISFNFENPSAKDKAVREVVKQFTNAGGTVVTAEVDATSSRKSGITYRNLNLSFADGQNVTMSFKTTGDVFEIKINGKVVPLHNQDDHKAAILEIATKLEIGRAKFQAALAKVRVPLPPSIKVSRTKMLEAKVDRRDSLVNAIEQAKAEYESIKGSAVAQA